MRKAAFGAALAVIALGSMACSSADGAADGPVRGTLVAYVAKMEDGTSRNEYRLFVERDELRARELVFENPADLESGSEIEVWADERDGALVVRRFESREAESDGLGRAEQAIIDGTPYETRRVAYVLVDIGGGNGNYTEAQARIDVFGTSPGNGSLKQWLVENSYGRQDITGEVVTGLAFDMTGCDYTALTSELRPRVNELIGTPADHYLWQFRTHNPSCGWAGVASVGSAMSPRKDTWFNSATGCTVLVQEPLHNFGMQQRVAPPPATARSREPAPAARRRTIARRPTMSPATIRVVVVASLETRPRAARSRRWHCSHSWPLSAGGARGDLNESRASPKTQAFPPSRRHDADPISIGVRSLPWCPNSTLGGAR